MFCVIVLLIIFGARPWAIPPRCDQLTSIIKEIRGK